MCIPSQSIRAFCGVLCFVILTLSSSAQITWTEIPIPATDRSLYNIDFVSETLGFLSDAKGMVLRTTDAGESWDSIGTMDSPNVYAMSFLDSNTGIAAGDGVGFRLLSPPIP